MGPAPLYWLVTYSGFFLQQLITGRKHRSCRAINPGFIKPSPGSRGRSHNLDMFLMDPYILPLQPLQDYSSYQTNPYNTRTQRITMFDSLMAFMCWLKLIIWKSIQDSKYVYIAFFSVNVHKYTWLQQRTSSQVSLSRGQGLTIASGW